MRQRWRRTITRGGIGTVNGRRLKFDPAAPDEGIVLQDTDGGAPIRVLTVQRNKPAQLVFQIPTAIVAPRTYWLSVSARVRHSSELRTGWLDATLTAHE